MVHKSLFSANIRRLVLLTVFLSVLPPFGILLFKGVHRYEEMQARAINQSLLIVHNIAGHQEIITHNLQALLASLRRIISLEDFIPGAYSKLFENILSQNTSIRNIFIFSPDGTVLSSGLPLEEPTSLLGSPFFENATLSSSGYVQAEASSNFSSEPVLRLSLPLGDRPGSTHAYLGAELSIKYFDSIFAGESLPPTSEVFLLNHLGQVLLASSPAPYFLSQSEKMLLWEALLNADELSEIVFNDGQKGEESWAFYEPLFFPGMEFPYFYVVMTMPKGVPSAVPASILWHDLLLLAISTLLATGVGIFLCRYGFEKPVSALTSLTERLSHGETGLHLNQAHKLSGEFRALSNEFNALAKDLDERNKALEAARTVGGRKSAAKGEFLAGISQEIRSLVIAILGMSHLAEKSDLHEGQYAQVSKIRLMADKLLPFVSDIFDFAKSETGKMRIDRTPFHLGWIISTVRSNLIKQHKEREIRLITRIPLDMPTQFAGDPFRLGQALSIMVGKAVQLAENAPVELSTNMAQCEESECEIHFTATVHGIDITEETLQQLDRLFHHHSPVLSRLDIDDLSLRLCGSLIRIMGGIVRAQKLDQGFSLTATVRLQLPQRGSADQILRFDGERALILAPDANIRQTFRTLLELNNLRTEECAEMAQAEKLLLQADCNGNPFTIVIVEIPLELIEPSACCNRIKVGLSLPHPPLIILSTSEAHAKLPGIIDSAIDAVLFRPVNESVLVDTLSALIHEKHRLDGDKNTTQWLADSRFEGLRILLVDDSLVNREIAQEILGSLGGTVEEAENGAEALSLIEQKPLRFDIVLMDLEMPVMDGKTAVCAIRNEFSLWRLPVIAMTAHNSPEDVAACLEAGMNDHTVKPIMVSQLLRALWRWLPPSHADAVKALELVQDLRDVIILSHRRDPRIASLLEELVPFIHTGRVEVLRNLLWRHDSGTAIALLDEYLIQEAHNQHPDQRR